MTLKGDPRLLKRFLVFLSPFPGCLGAQGKFAYKLFNDLFVNYSSALRPAEDTDRVLNVTLQVTLSQIIDMVTGLLRTPG